MVHSVWDWDRLRYDYYLSAIKASVGGWKPLTGLGVPAPKAAFDRNSIGVDIEAALPVLPSSVRKVGVGVIARGQVCRRAAGGVGAADAVASTAVPGLSHLSIFLLGMSTGALFNRVNPLVVGGLVVSAFLLGNDVARVEDKK